MTLPVLYQPQTTRSQRQNLPVSAPLLADCRALIGEAQALAGRHEHHPNGRRL